MPVRSADLPEGQANYLERYREQNEVSKSDAMRDLLERGIKAHDKRFTWSQEARIGSHMLGMIGLLVLAASLYIPVVPVVQGVSLTLTILMFAVALSALSSWIKPEGI